MSSRKCIKYTENEMRDYCDLIPKVVYIGYDDLKEEYKQVIVDNIYCPYIISNYGRLFSVDYHSIPGCVKEIKVQYDKNGYIIANISVNGKAYYPKIHRLVGLSFIPNPNNKPEINHLDGDKTNNIVTNLEWATNSENIIHAFKYGLHKPISSEDVWCSIYSKKQIEKICDMLLKNKPIKEIVKETGVKNYTIHCILRKKKWKKLTKKYDFSNYHFGKDVETIEEICRLLESNKYSQTDIAKVTNTNVKLVHSILTGHGHTDISKDYDFSKYTKYKYKKVQRLSKA